MDILTRWHIVVWVVATSVAWLVTDHYPPWTSFHGELIAAVGGASLVLYALAAGSRRVRLVPLALLAWTLVPLSQWLAGLVTYSGDALLASVYLAGAALCMWAGGATAEPVRQRLLRAFVALFLVLAIAGTGIALYQLFDLTYLGMWAGRADVSGRATANLGQANHFASMLCFGLAAIVLLRAQGTLGTPTAMLSAAFVLVGLALTQSRVPWVALPVIALWTVLRRQALGRSLGIRGAALVSLAAWYGVAFWAAQRAQLALQLADRPGYEHARLSAGTRPTVWAQWLEAIRDAPWWGVGWQQGNAAQLSGSVAHPGYEFMGGYGHNLALDLLAWNGVPLGLILLAVLVGWYLRTGLRSRGPQQWFCFAVVSTVAVHSMLEHPHSYVYFLIPTLLLAGQLDAAIDHDAGRTGGWTMPRGLLGVFAVLSIGTGVLVARDYIVLEADLRVVRAQQLNIGGERTSDAPAGIVVLDQLLSAARAARIHPRPGMPAAELDELLAVTKRYPTRYFLQQSAVALALDGRPDEARRYVRWIASVYGRRGLLGVIAVLEEGEANKPMGLGPTIAEWKKLVPPK